MDTGERNKFTGKELFDRHIEVIPTLLDPIFPKKGIVVLAGSSDTGKSSFLRDFAISVAEGKNDYLGFRLHPTHNKIIYYSTEDDDDSLAYLLYKQREKISNPEKLSNIKFIFHLNDPIQELEAELQVNPVDCIIIDALGDILEGNMNHLNDVRTYLSNYKIIANRYNCLIILLHHTNKNSENAMPSKHHISGSHGLEAKSRLAIEFRKDKSNANKRHICIVKGNYLTEDYKTKSFVLTFNEDMTYSLTNERVSFSDLVSGNAVYDEKEAAKRKARELKQQGKSHRKIAELITSTGYKVSSSTISNWLK